MPELALEVDDGTTLSLNVARWNGRPGDEELGVLGRALAPAVDLGCGPGRHVVALAEQGIPALGIDAAPTAVASARARGALVLERSVFARIPGGGRWGTVLLLDGNIGIGGDAVALLRRARDLLRPGGNVLIEAAPPHVPSRSMRVRLVDGPWFRWSLLSATDVIATADAAHLDVAALWEGGGRWFSELVRT